MIMNRASMASMSALLLTAPALAADQPAIGPWNAVAAKTAENSPLARSAYALITAEIAGLEVRF